MAFAKKDFQRVFKKVTAEVGSSKYDNWSFISVRYKKMDATLGNFFISNDLKKLFTQNPTFLQHIKFDGYGKPISLRPIFTHVPIPKKLLEIENKLLAGVYKVTLSLPYWILFRKLRSIHLNKKGLTSEEQMKTISLVYDEYCAEDEANN